MWPAAIITGLVFGAIHAGSAPAGFLCRSPFFGFVLCLLYWRTGSLYPCIALHALNNSLAFGVTRSTGTGRSRWWSSARSRSSALVMLAVGDRAPPAAPAPERCYTIPLP